MTKVLNPEAAPWSPVSSIVPHPHNIYYCHQLPFTTATSTAAAYPTQPFPPTYMQPPYQQTLQFLHHQLMPVYDFNARGHLYNNQQAQPLLNFNYWNTAPNLDVHQLEIMAETFPTPEKKRGGCVSLPPPRLRNKPTHHGKVNVSPHSTVTKMWKIKAKDHEMKHNDNNNVEEIHVQEQGSGSSTIVAQKKKTSVMIRNIPNQFRREELLQFLDFYCDIHKLEYDFFYLPMDFRSHNNFGYAFVNFTTSSGASKIMTLLDGHKWRAAHSQLHAEKSKKICRLNWARIQGKKELIKNFQQSKFGCDENEYLPVVFSPPRNGSSCLSNPSIIGNLRGRYQVQKDNNVS